MRKVALAVLALGWLGLTTQVVAQNFDPRRPRDDRASDFDRDDRRSYDDRQSTSRSSRGDADSTADSDDSWTEWFSDWWSGEENNGRQGSGASGSRGSAGSRSNSGLEQFFSRHDENDDGYLSRQELPSNLRNIDKLDRDGDGYLSKSELRRHGENMQAQRTPVTVTYIWVLDANQGRLRLSELQEAYDTLQNIDDDGDGEITRDELQQRQQQVASRFIDKCFQSHDENNDDQISLQEARGTHLSSKFDRLDRNGDDKLSRTELRTAMQSSSSQQRDSERTAGQDRSSSERRFDGGQGRSNSSGSSTSRSDDSDFDRERR